MKKTLVIILALIMVLCIAPAVFASGSATVTFSSETAANGDDVVITISLADFPGVKSMMIIPEYDDSVLELVSGKWDEDATEAAPIAVNWSKKSGNAVVAFDENTDINGVVFNLKFEVKENAVSGANANVSGRLIIKTMNGKIEEAVEHEIKAGSVNVGCAHTNIENQAGVSATCTEPGFTAGAYCNDCKSYISGHEEISASGHIDANKDYVCDECKLPFCTEHTPEIVAGKKATCTEDGLTNGSKCAKCDKVLEEQKTIPAGGHSYTSAVTKATCEERGYTTYTCGKCGDSYKDDTVAATGHEWDGGKVTKEPTTSAEGEKTFKCTVCKETKTEKIDKLPEDKPDDPKPVDNPFKDVAEKDYYFEPVMWAVEKGVTSGLSADSFGPAAGCTRAQVVTFLWRAAGKPAPASNVNPFKDVAEGQYYYEAVLWAVENGITTGLSADTFGPNANCNRGQIVTFLWRAMGKPAPTNSSNPFADVPETQYYYDAVLWAVEKGITTGMSATSFGPNSTCTRGQIVTFLYRAYAD